MKTTVEQAVYAYIHVSCISVHFHVHWQKYVTQSVMKSRSYISFGICYPYTSSTWEILADVTNLRAIIHVHLLNLNNTICTNEPLLKTVE